MNCGCERGGKCTTVSRCKYEQDMGEKDSCIDWLKSDNQKDCVQHAKEMAEKDARIAELEQWVHDLQSGMYINCVYCGHRYGSVDKVPSTMADVLKAHIEVCPQHPMSKLRQERDALRAAVEQLNAALWDSHYGRGIDVEYVRAVDRIARAALNKEPAK